MSELDAQFERAVTAYKAGDKHQARELLLDLVEQDERHEQAWLYLSALVTTLDEQQICLENVLAINPDNQRAKKGLEKVNEQIAARDQRTGGGSSPVAPPPQPQQSPSNDEPAPFESLSWDSIPAPSDTADGFGEDASSDAGFGAAPTADEMGQSEPGGFPSFDSLDLPEEPEAASDNAMAWFNDASEPEQPQAPEPGSMPTSVDWGADSGPTTHGSGQTVDLPTEQQYDEWVKGLNIETFGQGAAQPEMPDADATSEQAQQSAFMPDDIGPFGDTGYMLDDDGSGPGLSGETASGAFGAGALDRAGGPTPGVDDAEFGASALETGLDATSFADDAGEAEDVGHVFKPEALYGAEAGDYAADVTPFDAASPYEDEVERPDDDLSDLDFSFDDVDDDMASGEEDGAGAASGDAVAAAHARYFAMIPDDIESRGGGTRRTLLVVGILVLVVLNVASFGWLLM